MLLSFLSICLISYLEVWRPMIGKPGMWHLCMRQTERSECSVKGKSPVLKGNKGPTGLVTMGYSC